MSFTFSLLVPVADIKAIVTGKDCPHMKEKSALKQNKVSALFLPVINIQCYRVEDWKQATGANGLPHWRCIVCKTHLVSGPFPSTHLWLLGAVSIVWLCYRLFSVGQNTETGKCTVLQQGSFCCWVSRQEELWCFVQSMSERFFSLQEVLELAFSILYDPDETLNFIAPNKYEVRNTAGKW